MDRKVADRIDARKYQQEMEEYLIKKLENATSFEKKVQKEMVEKYGLWVTIDKAAEIIKRSRSTMYKYKDENLLIYRQTGRIISIYTKSLILVL